MIKQNKTKQMWPLPELESLSVKLGAGWRKTYRTYIPRWTETYRTSVATGRGESFSKDSVCFKWPSLSLVGPPSSPVIV